MPKSLDKTKGAQKRKKTPANSAANTESDGSGTKPAIKKKKRNSMLGIGMSKQLAAEVKKKRSVRSRNPLKKNNEPRICANGIPMPSLAELEAMYTDSDDDETTPPKPAETTTTERCTTPEQKPLLPNDVNFDNSETLKKITSEVINLISKTIVIDDHVPPPPVIPQKKPKKSGIPYIIGCKERKQVPWAPKTKFCVGDEEYGVDPNQSPDEDDKCPAKRKKRGKKVNLSKSIFNAQSDEIAERLKNVDNVQPSPSGSPDSNRTIEYEIPGYFSPVPSTSKDSETILKNDRLFNESLQLKSLESVSLANDSVNEVEVVEIPCETVVIDDELPDIKLQQKQSIEFEDDCCILVEPQNDNKRKNSESTITLSPKDDIYGSIDLTQTFDDEVFEIDYDDIDRVMAENKAVIEKNLVKNSIDTITSVDPNIIVIETDNKKLESGPSTGTSISNLNEPQVVCHPPDVVECVEIDNQINVSENNTIIQNSNSEIATVVTNFFNQPQISETSSRRSNESTSTIDLTSSQDTMMSRISSWIFSIESFLSGRHNSRRNVNVQPEIINLDYNNTTVENERNNNQNSNNQVLRPVNNNAVPNTTNVSPSVRYQLNNQSCSSTTQAHQNSSSMSSEPSPPKRGLGDCPICMDSLANNSVASTMCGHVFCMACIKAAIRANGKKCPTCRKALKGAGFHQLFL